jgi:hypothetical protein
MDGDTRLLHVVGVVGDVRERGLDADVRPAVYTYSVQRPLVTNFSYVIRAGADDAHDVEQPRVAVHVTELDALA